MKIGFDAKRCFCNFTGLGNYSRTILNNLGDFYPENEYHLYTTGIKNITDTRFTDKSCFHKHLPGTFFKSYWRSFSIVKQLGNDGIKLYHGLSNEIPVNIHKTSVKSIVTIHDLIFKKYPETYSLTNRLIYDQKFRYSCKHAGMIIAISENTRRDIIEYYGIDPDKIEVIYQSCNPIYYSLRTDDKNKVVPGQYNIPGEYLLYVGSIEPRKNLKTIIKSYQYLKPDLKIPLVVVGKGGRYRHEAEELTYKTGIDKMVIWLSLFGNDHLQLLYQNALALVYPSFYEGFGLPVVEALLSRTPVITSGTSSLPEAGGPHSVYIDPNSPEQLADGIEKVLTGSVLRKKMKDEGYLYAMRNFAREIVTEKLINCYSGTYNNS
jgi:glycosyltransferase involved in cell wall biosynthesis